jgi:hypothetical protein
MGGQVVMSKKQIGMQLSVSLFGVWLAAAPAAAQAPPPQSPGGIAPPARTERPYRGLFGSSVGNTAQSLTLDGTFGGGFVEDPVAEQGGSRPAADPNSSGGASFNGSATTAYSWNRERFSINLNHQGVVDFYPGLDEHKMLPRHIANGYFTYRPSESTNVTLIETFKNLPEFSFSDFFDPELEQALQAIRVPRLTLDRYVRFGTGIEATHKLSKRTKVQADLNWAHGKVAEREWTILNGSATISHNIAKDIKLFVGYQEGGQQDRSGGIKRPRERQPRINGGVDYNRALSFSRRTTLMFQTGVAGVRNRELQETTYHLIGSVRLNREFGQTWLAGVSYARDVRQVESVGEFLFADHVSVGLTGSFSQRLQLQSRMGISNGRLGTTGSKYETKFGSMQLSYALHKLYALGADYVYSRYSAKSGAPPLESLNELNSGSVRAYLQIWLPLYTRTRR